MAGNALGGWFAMACTTWTTARIAPTAKEAEEASIPDSSKVARSLRAVPTALIGVGMSSSVQPSSAARVPKFSGSASAAVSGASALATSVASWARVSVSSGMTSSRPSC